MKWPSFLGRRKIYSIKQKKINIRMKSAFVIKNDNNKSMRKSFKNDLWKIFTIKLYFSTLQRNQNVEHIVTSFI